MLFFIMEMEDKLSQIVKGFSQKLQFFGSSDPKHFRILSPKLKLFASSSFFFSL